MIATEPLASAPEILLQTGGHDSAASGEGEYQLISAFRRAGGQDRWVFVSIEPRGDIPSLASASPSGTKPLYRQFL